MAKVAPNPAQLAAHLVARFGHPDDMAAALAEDVTWWESPSAPAEIMASVSTGRDTVRGNMQRVFSLIYNGSTVNTTVHHAIS
jgi:ketosteroid isomerase-like protein